MTTEDTVAELLEPIVASLGADLVDVDFNGGILRLTVDASKSDALVADLEGLSAEGFEVRIDAGEEQQPVEGNRYRIELLGHDHEGIVRDIAAALASRRVNVEDLTTETTSAPQAGGNLFKADVLIRVPESVSLDELEQTLEGLANRDEPLR